MTCGIHAAEIVAGKTFGVAERFILVNLKIFEEVETDTTIALKGLNCISRFLFNFSSIDTSSEPIIKEVINMPWLTEDDSTLNRAIEEITKLHNVVIVVAGGNYKNNSCNIYTANSEHVLVVGAIDELLLFSILDLV